jgi:GNAT superfamily N-acetyltransferase
LTYHIRPARESDASQLFPLAREFATSFEPRADALESSLRDILANEAAWLGVAEATDQLVGYVLGFEHCTFYANGRVSWVEELTVRSDWRGRGVGRALMRAFEGWATRRGAKLVALATRRAAPFYRALGYEESATYFRRLL